MDFSMYDTLLLLPLFQGLSKNDITDILTKVKFHFRKYEPGSCIYRQGDLCTEVSFFLSGSVMAETDSRNGSYLFCEAMPVPHVVELYSLFGIYPCYNASYKAVTEVSLLSIDKYYLLDQLNSYIPCGLNFSNIIFVFTKMGLLTIRGLPSLCSGTLRAFALASSPVPGTIFVTSLCSPCKKQVSAWKTSFPADTFFIRFFWRSNMRKRWVLQGMNEGVYCVLDRVK